jgi:uncharacterized protein (DUF2062 family)/SAM-dependent methyltransferase
MAAEDWVAVKPGAVSPMNAVRYSARDRAMTSARPIPSDLPRLRRLGRTMAEMHVQLRTEGDTPVRKALSVGLGTLVGCTPLYGLHLPLCAGLAKLFGLNLIRTYLAAYVGNPLTLPFLLYAELGVGNLLFGDSWPALSFDELQLVNVWSLGRNILVGSVALGLVLGAVFAVIAYAIGSRWEAPPLRALLIEGASRRYVEAGIFHWEVVRGKLKGDPIYFALLESGLLPREGLLVDLGCGRGILLSLLATARQLRREGKWSAPRSPPAELALAGVELRPRIAAVAAGALGADAEIRVADLTGYTPPPCRAVVLLDVLHYLDPADQTGLLARSAAALAPGGVLILRDADAGLGWRFFLTRVGERLAALARGQGRRRFHYRRADAWGELLRSLGLEVTSTPMWDGTPFGNVLVVGRKAD